MSQCSVTIHDKYIPVYTPVTIPQHPLRRSKRKRLEMATVFFLLIVCSVFHNSTPTPTPKYQRWNELIEKYQQWTGFHDHSKGGSIPGDDSKSRVRRAFGPSGASGVGGLGVKANYSDRYRVSERCMNHTEMYISGLLGMQNWAMRSEY